jgi:hypothetical protein
MANNRPRRSSGRGREGVRRGAGGTQVCECPECGHSKPHVRGTPCSEKKCPKCGTVMVGKFCAPTSSAAAA